MINAGNDDRESDWPSGPLVKSGRSLRRGPQATDHSPSVRLLSMPKSYSRSLLRRAIDVTDLSDRAFARRVLNVDERTVRRWLAAERRVPGAVIAISQAIVDHPVIARALARAVVRVRNMALRKGEAPHS